MNGTDLEDLVAQLETTIGVPGFSIELRRREFDTTGVQIAEFDIVLTGRIGSAPITWLIECRDRPSEGAAPAAWIEQLVGRRARFSFDKVMAVSTTGFAPGAIEYAREQGIALRTVRELTAADLGTWLATTNFTFSQQHVCLTYAQILIADSESRERQEEVGKRVLPCRFDEACLFNPLTNETVSALVAFMGAVDRRPQLWPMSRQGESVTADVEIDAIYPPGDQYAIRTSLGDVFVPRILFRGTLSLATVDVPFSRFIEYADSVTGKRLVASARANFDIRERSFLLQVDRVAVGGVETVAVRIV